MSYLDEITEMDMDDLITELEENGIAWEGMNLEEMRDVLACLEEEDEDDCE